MDLPRKLNLLKYTTLATILLMTLLVSMANGQDTSQSTAPPSLALLGAASKWASSNGDRVLLVNTKDNWLNHHLTDGADWGPYPEESVMDKTRSSLTLTLIQYGFEVHYSGDIPEDLSGYDLVVLESYWAVEPRHSSLIKSYLSNGGGVVVLSGVPCLFSVYCKDWWPYRVSQYPGGPGGTDLTPLQDWFGSGQYANAFGVGAKLTIDNPFETPLSTGDTLVSKSNGAAAVTDLSAGASVIAEWETGLVFAFTHEYGQGRVYYQAWFDSDYPTSDYVATSISISTNVPSSIVGSAVEVNGALKDAYGNGLANEIVFFYYTFSGYESWIPVTSAATNEFGQYDIKWIPSATGDFKLIVEWKGNATHSGSSDKLSLGIVPYKNEGVFSFESNSTVSALAFNSTSLELSFTVSGTSETTGYVEVTVAKRFISNPENIKLYLDGNQLNYSVASTKDTWLFTFTYSHSEHEIILCLGSAIASSTCFSADYFVLLGVMAALAASIVIFAVALQRMKKK